MAAPCEVLTLHAPEDQLLPALRVRLGRLRNWFRSFEDALSGRPRHARFGVRHGAPAGERRVPIEVCEAEPKNLSFWRGCSPRPSGEISRSAAIKGSDTCHITQLPGRVESVYCEPYSCTALWRCCIDMLGAVSDLSTLLSTILHPPSSQLRHEASRLYCMGHSQL